MSQTDVTDGKAEEFTSPRVGPLSARLTMFSGLELTEPTVQTVERFLEERRLRAPRLSLVLTELLRNAVSHGNAGDISKSVEIDVRIAGHHSVEISVQDQGGGFEWRALNYDIPDSPRQLRQRGLLLVANSVRIVEFNDKGNRVTIQMDCDPIARHSQTSTGCQQQEVLCGDKPMMTSKEPSEAFPRNCAVGFSPLGAGE